MGGPRAPKLIEISAFDLAQARRGGKQVYLLEYDLIHDMQRQGKNPLAVLKQLMAAGEILETAFDLGSAGTLEEEPSNQLLLEVLYATALDAESISRTLDIAAARVTLIAAPQTGEPQTGRTPPRRALVAPEAEIMPAEATRVEGSAKPAAQAQAQVETTIRLNVALLDSLMTLAGELVLSRKQLNEAVAHNDEQGVRAGAHRVSLVTSELQEAVSLTRMQPVGSLFAKFPRLVRDLAGELGKQVHLQLGGGDVELDKTILEGLSDPLTHMVRNAVDHGIEAHRRRTRQEREGSGGNSSRCGPSIKPGRW